MATPTRLIAALAVAVLGACGNDDDPPAYVEQWGTLDAATRDALCETAAIAGADSTLVLALLHADDDDADDVAAFVTEQCR